MALAADLPAAQRTDEADSATRHGPLPSLAAGNFTRRRPTPVQIATNCLIPFSGISAPGPLAITSPRSITR